MQKLSRYVVPRGLTLHKCIRNVWHRAALSEVHGIVRFWDNVLVVCMWSRARGCEVE